MISYEPLFRTMKEKHISSYELAKRGFPRSTYYAIKQGKSVTTNTVNQCRMSSKIDPLFYLLLTHLSDCYINC